MPTYVAKVRKDSGETVEQLVTVPRENQLGEYLTRIDGFVLNCSPYESQAPDPVTLAMQTQERPDRGNTRVRSRTRDLVSFTWYLHTMVNAGVPLARALEIVGRQIGLPDWEKVISSLLDSLKKGETFADSLKRYPRFFPKQFVHLIEVGEVAGSLELVLGASAEFYEKQLESRSRVKSAMAYPVLLLSACTVVIFFLIAFVLPRIAKMFVKVETELPWITKFLLSLSEFLRSHFPHLGVALVAAGFGAVLAFKTARGRRLMDHTRLRLPMLGNLYQKAVLGRFCQTLSLLQRSGVALLVSLRLARQGMSNVVLEEFFTEVEQNLQEGTPLGEELARCPFVPDMVSSMVSVGEETGQLSQMLEKVSLFYEREIDQIVRTLPKIIEPAIIVLMTTVVGLLAASVFVPLSTLAKGFG